MAPPLAINKEQILDIFFGIWPTADNGIIFEYSDGISIYNIE